MSKQPTQKGAALLLFVLFFMIASVGITFMIARGMYSDFVVYRWLTESKQSFYAAESLAEDVAFRMVAPQDYDTTEALSFAGASATATVTFDSVDERFTISSTAETNSRYRQAELVLALGSGASFNFGVQTGNGGFEMQNSSSVKGNVFSNGDVIGGGSSRIYGDVIAAGPTGFADGIHATGSVWANRIESGTIEGDAYYQSINLSNTTVWGDLHPSWPDEATSSLPIPDEVVDQHKASTTEAIAAGDGTLIAATDPRCSATGTYVIDSSTTFTGPTKIDCDVSVEKTSTTLTLTDTLWVAGNMSFAQGPTIEADPATSTNSVLIIVDDESDRLTSSKIIVNNSTEFVAASSPKSYIVLLSMNESAEQGGSETAITMGQSSNGDVVIYSGHGKIALANGIYLKEVTGYLISMGNNTTIEYESGLVNLNFTSGPGGGFEIERWREV